MDNYYVYTFKAMLAKVPIREFVAQDETRLVGHTEKEIEWRVVCQRDTQAHEAFAEAMRYSGFAETHEIISVDKVEVNKLIMEFR